MPSTSKKYAGSFRFSPARSTASRSSISTAGPRPRNPRCGDRPVDRSTGRLNANIHRGVHLLSEEATGAVRGRPAEDRRRSSGRPRRRRSSSRRAPRRRSTRWLTPGASVSCRRATTSSSARWSTTRTSCRGRCWPNARGRNPRASVRRRGSVCARNSFRRSWTNVRAWWPSRRPPTRSARAPDLRTVVEAAHAAGAVAVVDGCQGVVHGGVDVRAMDCDFYAFSGHKLYGPTGIGVLYGKRELLERMPRSWAAATWSTR